MEGLPGEFWERFSCSKKVRAKKSCSAGLVDGCCAIPGAETDIWRQTFGDREEGEMSHLKLSMAGKKEKTNLGA